MTKKVLIPLADGCEELEAVTLIDLLRRASIQVVTAGIDEHTIMASRGTRLIADTLLDDVVDEDFDMVLLPGGLPGADNLNADPLVHDILIRSYDNGHAVAAICAAPKVLAQAGLLENKRATCYPGSIDTQDWPKTTFTDQAVEIDDRVLTSKGPGTAMDFALAIIAYLANQETHDMVEEALMRPA